MKKLFSDVLITTDYDYTLTGPDGVVPQRNLTAIRYFIENGGHFTVNTGRSYVYAKVFADIIPKNAPLLLMNGSMMYENGSFVQLHTIPLDPWQVLTPLAEEFPQVKLEVHGLDTHYILNLSEADVEAYRKMQVPYTPVQPGDDMGPFLKFNVQALRDSKNTDVLRSATEAEARLFDNIQRRIEELWGDKLTVYRSGARLLNVHAKGCSKLTAARNLKTRLGKNILVCVGDAENDIAMLDGADYAFCPADGVVANRYENVCQCSDGALADVIYEKIPEILRNQP